MRDVVLGGIQGDDSMWQERLIGGCLERGSCPVYKLLKHALNHANIGSGLVDHPDENGCWIHESRTLTGDS